MLPSDFDYAALLYEDHLVGLDSKTSQNETNLGKVVETVMKFSNNLTPLKVYFFPYEVGKELTL